MLFTVDECWLNGWRGASALEAGANGIRLATGPEHAGKPARHLAGTVFPGFVDSHVHLGLVDATELFAGGIAAVDDLGWDPHECSQWKNMPGPTVRYAGAFITAPGGYPVGREWAPEASTAEVDSAGEAREAIDNQLALGASFIKVTLNADAGPTLDDTTLHAAVGHAHVRGREVVAHVQGAGQAQRAFEAGVDRLAHTPWTERLDDSLLAAMAGPRARSLTGAQTWVSTLDIHSRGDLTEDFVTARDNLRRFHAYGGTIIYGTDLGNGPLPVGINERELRALISIGMSENAVVRSLVGPRYTGVLNFVPGPRTDDFAEWLGRASVVTAEELNNPDYAPPIAA